MTLFYICAALAALSACTLFQKNQPSNEMEALTEDVLKRGEGVEVDVKPIPKA